ncbi:MAG: penicillin-insensitive murein endopeptidase [Pseudomonadota bacterium]
MAHWRIALGLVGLLAIGACTEFDDTVATPVAQAAPEPIDLSGPKANSLFAARPTPSEGAPTPIGGYAKGCAAGLQALPESGPTWQAMRLSRNRYWGHPETIDYLQKLSAFASTQPGWEGLYIGDLSQPRGGPMLTGHQSHQNGLDADIWMLPPKRLNLSATERENISSIAITNDFKRLNGNWTPQHAAVLEAAARDERVDRIFVTAPVKIALCQSATRADREWLQKIRPFWLHNYHFHVRLKCPADAPDCVTQTPSVAELSNGGDGCDESLNWWVTTALEPAEPDPDAPPAPKRRNARDLVMAELPKQCEAVLNAPG